MKPNIFLADLTHSASGVSALTFPLGTAFVASYAQKMLGDIYNIELFKFPDPLSQAILDKQPLVLACSNYSWNLELTYKLLSWAKSINPNVVTVLGGPNFPVTASEKSQFLGNRSAIDFYIELEGELGFVDLLERLGTYQFDVPSLKNAEELVANCSYLHDDTLVCGEVQRIKDVNAIPSPYLTGFMDQFFAHPLIPMIETTRGCPFSCSFCADGMASKSKIERFNQDRTKEELRYIAERVQDIDELIITDLNFGMYKPDIQTAQLIADTQLQHNWPKVVAGSAGKNVPERVIKAATILNGSFVVGAAMQSTDPEVLKNIKRSNISLETFRQFNQYMNELDEDALTYTEIILALPGDTKEKHFESLRSGVEGRVNAVRMYQATLLTGTEMASPETRAKFELLTKFRIIPGGVGVYRFGSAEVPVAEIDEIIVGSKDMPFEDYVSCRTMNLLIETFVNNAFCEEIFAALRTLDLSVFDFLVYLHQQDGMYSPNMKKVLSSYVAATKDDLYDSRAEAEEKALSPEFLDRYLTGELGSNEILDHKAMLYLELADTMDVLAKVLRKYLNEKGFGDESNEYFDELMTYIVSKKGNIHIQHPEFKETFSYDFAAIEVLKFEVDPRNLQKCATKQNYRFFHEPYQEEIIVNANYLYKNHPGGIGRMIQRSNLNMMFRKVELV